MARPQDPAAATRFPGFSYRAGWAAFTSKEGDALLPGCVPQTLHTIHARASGYEDAAITDQLPGTLDQPTLITVRLRKNPRATSRQGTRSADGPAGR